MVPVVIADDIRLQLDPQGAHDAGAVHRLARSGQTHQNATKPVSTSRPGSVLVSTTTSTDGIYRHPSARCIRLRDEEVVGSNPATPTP
jgi:hypothetical protein